MLQEVIAAARRRLWWNALTFHLTVSLIVGLTSVVLLLLLGTDIVAGHWLITLPLGYLAAAAWISWRRLPASSPTAQLLDSRLDLADTLSTAWFFAHPDAARPCAEEFREAQNAQAARIAAGVDVRAVIPVRIPRAVYLSPALAVAAIGLFVVRYQSAAHLDLREPLAGIVQQLLENTRVELAKLVDEFRPSKVLERIASDESRQRAAAAAGENADAKPSGAGDSNQAENGSGGQADREKEVPDTFAGEEQQGQQGNQMSADGQTEAQRNSSSQRENEGAQQQPQGSGNQSASSTSGSSMVNKLKNSLANLLSAMKPPSGGTGGQQAMKAQDGRPSGNNRKQGASESGDASGDPGQGESSKPGSALAGGAGQAGKSQSDKQQGTGAGRDEGSKEIRAAAQLDAMGRLNTIFGKRAENLSGEFSVEAPPGPQNLRTAYEARAAEHSAAETAEIRDEVPVAYQEYVKHYYDLLREADALAKRQGRVMAASTRRPRSAR